MTPPRKSRSTLRRVERAAMRMVDRRGELIRGTHCKSYYERRAEFEDACAAHAAVKAKRGKGKP